MAWRDSFFVRAGAGGVGATLWAVDDRATAVLMEAFYQVPDAGSQPARALAQAQRQSFAGRATSHPFYWAGIVAVQGRPR